MQGRIDFKTLAESLPTLCWTAAPDGHIVWYNRRWYEYTGSTPAEMEGWGWQSVHDPEALPRVLARWRDSIEKGAPFEMIFPLRDASGTFQPFLTRIVPAFDEDGRVTAWFGVNTNISEQVAAEDALRRAESTLRDLNSDLEVEIAERTQDRDRIWTLSPDLLMVGSLDGWMIRVNPAWFDVLGYDEATLLSRPFWDLIHPDFLDIFVEATKKMARGHTVRFQSMIRSVEETYRWFDWVAAPVGTVFYAIARDITERKADELALGEAKRESDVARAQAEAANRAKSEFLASMSHEIRTPLHGVLGYADLLSDGPNLTVVQIQQIARLRSAGAALLTIVNDILDYSKIEAGRLDLELQPFSPIGLIDNALSIVRSSAESKRLALTETIDPRLPARLIGDQDRLRQVLLNLLNNAIKFTSVGSVALLVTCEADKPGLWRLRFAVADTGIGIPADKTSHVFERFSQVDGSIRREFGGTGLGLAISKQLVGLMGGTIGLQSEEGHGSTFFVDVTLSDTNESITPEQEIWPGGVEHRAELRILVAEDVEINQEIIRAVLEKANHIVEMVADGADAVRAMQSKTFDIVLMDVQMPGMDGIAATHHIRALAPPACRVPIIAMTANVLPQQIAQFRAAGMDDHVGKPFKREELFATVYRWAPARV